MPLHASALGKVLLAYGAAQLPKGPLQRCTERTITAESSLRAELATVRARGYAVTDEELEPGLIALAGAGVPLRRDGGGRDVGLRSHLADDPGGSG